MWFLNFVILSTEKHYYVQYYKVNKNIIFFITSDLKIIIIYVWNK